MKHWLYIRLLDAAFKAWDLGDWLEDQATKLGGKVVQGPWLEIEMRDGTRHVVPDLHVVPGGRAPMPDNIVPFPVRAS